MKQNSSALHDKHYPVTAVEAALGEECVSELRQAVPEGSADTGSLYDRFVINAGAVGYWLNLHFGVNLFAAKDALGIRVNPLAETITVRGTQYRLPHWCYLNTGLEPGDRRPTHWDGIARPTVTRAESPSVGY